MGETRPPARVLAMRVKLRPILVFWHRWFGLLAALWLGLMALTGMALVFYDEIDTALNPDWRLTAPRGAHAPASDVIAAAEAARPGGYASFVDLPAHGRETARILVTPRAGDEPHAAYVFVDPYTAEVLGARDLGHVAIDRRHVMDFIYQLHLDLNLGGPMMWFLGLVALLWALDHIVAAILAFPALSKWRRSFGVRMGAGERKFTYDLHRAAGLWLFPVTLTLAVSGVYFNWMPSFTHAVEMVSPVTPRYSETAMPLEAPRYEMAAGIDAALAAARGKAGGAAADMASYRPALGLFEFRLYDPRDIDSHGRRLITVDARTAAVLDDRHVARGTAGDVFLAWQYPLHSGKAFGWPGRILVLLSGLVTLALVVTGVQLYARTALARRVESRRL